MASSDIEVCNDALDRVWQSPILSLDDATVAGRLCARNFPLARDLVLASYPWNGCIARASLAAALPAPAFGFANRFPLPADCLTVHEIDDALAFRERWRVEGRDILTDIAGPLRVRYIRRAPVGDWSPHLANAVAARLATRLVGLAGNATLGQALAAAADLAHREARRLDAIEGSQDEKTIADDWLLAGGR